MPESRCRQRKTYVLPALLDGIHQTVKVGAERLQTCGIQEETALARGMGRGARGGGALLGEGDLLVLAEELDFALREAQLVVWYRGGHHTLLKTMVGHGAHHAWHPMQDEERAPWLQPTQRGDDGPPIGTD